MRLTNAQWLVLAAICLCVIALGPVNIVIFFFLLAWYGMLLSLLTFIASMVGFIAYQVWIRAGRH